MGTTSKKITKDLVVKLTPEEKSDLADQLTQQINRKSWLEDAKKVATKKYAAQIEETVAEINEISDKIRAGEELRKVECEIRFDDPIQGYKTTYRLDTGAKISSEMMTPEDLQGELFPEDQEEAENTEAEATESETADGENEASKTDGEEKCEPVGDEESEAAVEAEKE